MKNSDTVILLSGGLDSLVLAYKLTSEGKNCRCLYLDFDRPARYQELYTVKNACACLGLSLEVPKMSGLIELALGFQPPEYAIMDESDTQEGPIIRDPWRINRVSGFFSIIAIGLYYAQLAGASELAVGLIREQFDKNEALAENLVAFGKLASRFNPTAPVTIETPFSTLLKSEVISLGSSLNAPMHTSWSCTLRSDSHCGTCPSCMNRREAFIKSSVEDLTQYAKS